MEELGFLGELPHGPLDVYRKTASFDWKRLKLALEGDLDLLKLKYKVWHTLEKDPLFAHNMTTPSVEEQKRITQIQLKRINEYKFLSDETLTKSYSKRTRVLMTVNEAVQSLNPSVSVKMAIGIYLFSNALLSLGTERHRKFYEACISKREILASFALTEIAHGSDARLMRTTATYDPSTRSFVVHTPDFEAAKCWVGNLGRTCTHTLLFAQLITPDGTSHGLHGFVVPIRDPDTLQTYPGLIVGDMGEKIGVSGIDNGFIMFNQYRIPRENLLNRTADVTEEGIYESSFSEPSRILGAALENLSAGRIGIMQESCCSIAHVVSIAIRYAATRRQFGAAGDETPLLEYQLHQWRLFGYVAAAVVFRIYVESLTRTYLSVVEKSNAGQKVDNLSETVSEIHAIVSSSKPTITWTTLEAAQQCREACGGHGFLKCANIGEIRNNHEPTVTYEGDNNVLGQQAGNWLLRQYEMVRSGNGVDSPLGTVEFLKDFDRILASKFQCTTTEELKTPEFIISTYRWLLCHLLQQTHQQYESEIAKGLSKFDAKTKCQVYRWRTLTRAYAEYLALIFSLQSIEKKEMALQPVLNKFFVLYGLWSLDRHLVECYEGGFAVGGEMARLVRGAVLELCGAVRGEAVGAADALAPTDFVLNSVLGRSDGNCANIGEIRNNHEPTVTYEGDNNVLGQQAGNWLLRQYEMVRSGNGVDSPLGTVEFLKDFDRILASKFQCTTTEELKTPEFIISTYRWLLCHLLQQTHQQYESEIAKGLSKFDAKTKCQVYRWRTLTRAYAEYLALIFSLQSIEKKEMALQPVLNKFFVLYGLWSLDRHLVECYEGGFAVGGEMARLVRGAVLELCGAVRGEAVGAADALAPTDFVLNSVLGRSDGNLYQNLQQYLFSQPGAFERDAWWREVIDPPKSKL